MGTAINHSVPRTPAHLTLISYYVYPYQRHSHSHTTMCTTLHLSLCMCHAPSHNVGEIGMGYTMTVPHSAPLLWGDTTLLVLFPVKAVDRRRGGVLSFLCMRLTQLLQSLEWNQGTQYYLFHAEGESAAPTGSKDTCTTLAPGCNSSPALISASGSFWGCEELTKW